MRSAVPYLRRSLEFAVSNLSPAGDSVLSGSAELLREGLKTTAVVDSSLSCCLSSVTVAGPSGPGQSDHASTSHHEFPSRVARGRVATTRGKAPLVPRKCRDRAVRTERSDRRASAPTCQTNARTLAKGHLTERLGGQASAVSRKHLAERSGERALTSSAQIRAGGIRLCAKSGWYGCGIRARRGSGVSHFGIFRAESPST